MEISLDVVENGSKSTLLMRSEQPMAPRWAVSNIQEFAHSHLVPYAHLPFAYIPMYFTFLCSVPYLALANWWEWGFLSKDLTDLNFKPASFGAVAKLALKGFFLLFFSLSCIYSYLSIYIYIAGAVPCKDIGTVYAAKRGLIRVENENIESFLPDGKSIRFRNGQVYEFDGVVLCTGYRMFSAHLDFFKPKSFADKVGTGLKAVQSQAIIPGAEHPKIKNLWPLVHLLFLFLFLFYTY